MKIAFIITRLDDVGGAQIHVRDLSTALRAAGHDVAVIAGTNGALADELQAKGVPCYLLNHLARDVGPLHDIRCIGEMRRMLRRLQPDLRILVITGHHEPHYADAAYDAGADGFIRKGNAAAILEAVYSLLNDSRPQP